MFRNVVFVLTALFVLVGCNADSLLDRPVEAIYVPYGSDEDNYESVYLGKILRSGKTIKLEESQDPLVSFLYHFTESHRSDDVEQILSYWSSDDHDRIRAFMSDDELLQKSIDAASSVLSAEIVGYIAHDEYTLVMVEIDWEGYGRSVKVYPVKVEGGKFVATNALKADKVLHDAMAYGYAGWKR